MRSDYIVFVDESGDHNMTTIDPLFPVFSLAFCVMRKAEYIEKLTPKVRKLKMETFGHDMVILHEYDIRKQRGNFAGMKEDARNRFLESITAITREVDFKLFAVVIDKIRHKDQYKYPSHPYHIAMQFGLERIYGYLRLRKQHELRTNFICEARGKKEDDELELAFRRVCDGANYSGERFPFDIMIVDKKANCEGLQVADLMVRPIALSVLKPDQPNRAMDAIDPKFSRNSRGEKLGIGLKVFP